MEWSEVHTKRIGNLVSLFWIAGPFSNNVATTENSTILTGWECRWVDLQCEILLYMRIRNNFAFQGKPYLSDIIQSWSLFTNNFIRFLEKILTKIECKWWNNFISYSLLIFILIHYTGISLTICPLLQRYKSLFPFIYKRTDMANIAEPTQHVKV